MTGLGGPIPGPQHQTGSNYLFADGHVRLIGIASTPTTPVWDTVQATWVNNGPGSSYGIITLIP